MKNLYLLENQLMEVWTIANDLDILINDRTLSREELNIKVNNALTYYDLKFRDMLATIERAHGEYYESNRNREERSD